MAYQYYNSNPAGKCVGDCVIRAVSIATGLSWEESYALLSAAGLEHCDLPNADSVWGSYLMSHGFNRDIVKDNVTVADFADKHREGTFVLSIPGNHVVTVVNGDYYDSWDSGAEVPVYYYAKE